MSPDEISSELVTTVNLGNTMDMRSENGTTLYPDRADPRWVSQSKFIKNSSSHERIPVQRQENNILRDSYASRNVKTVQSSQENVVHVSMESGLEEKLYEDTNIHVQGTSID